MSSSYIVEPQGVKKDDTLILMVNDSGVISVDQDTLQSLILNQSNATVSVVRLGQTDTDAAEGNITLTIDPPPFLPTELSATNNTPDQTTLVDPFMEMDAEQLERLETALQSEEAKQILGENVTAMLDMLTVEEQQNSIRYSIELDHCYTSRFSPSQPKSTDSLPEITTFDIDESMCINFNKSTAHNSILLPVSSSNVNNASNALIKQRITSVPPKIVKQPISIGGRPRRTSAAMQPTISSSKSITNTNVQENKLHVKVNDEMEGNELFSFSESSESEESDSDSDFGPRPSRRGVRARGARRGLTTRGGSMAASRKRGSNKHMDSEQVRRLDLEMAAAVNAMKSPEKEEKSEKHSPAKNKKQLKTFCGKKKDELFPSAISLNDTPHVEANVLQTTNQVKANLINANMFKGDMILTRPGQDRNQKVVFVQKQVMMKPNDIKTSSIKKQITIQKNKLMTTSNSKFPLNKDIKISSLPTILKSASSNMQQPSTVHENVIAMEIQTESIENPIQTQKIASAAIIKTKSIDLKKEKKKVDIISEIAVKPTIEPSKSVDTKTVIAQKKIIKKEHRKSDTLVVEALGPALFSTPDIIRRVGSTSELKVTENPISTISTIPSPIITNTNVNSLVTSNVENISAISNLTVNPTISSISVTNITDESVNANISINDSISKTMSSKFNRNTSVLSEIVEDDKMNIKTTIVDSIQPALNTVSNSTKEMLPIIEQTSNLKHIVSESIEGDDHLLATLEMEAAKQLPNDEELLAEALLLQETLGVDLDHSGLVDPTPEMSESILSSSIMEPTSSMMGSLVKKVSTTVVTCVIPQELTEKSEPLTKKDVKDPIQIVRGGRIITLPPIEAPATRSKKLQTKTENQQIKTEKIHQQLKVEPLIIKTERTSKTIPHVNLQKQDMIYDMEDDEEEEEIEANSDSEDDPNRLWCICRQPHNNRFMICCDICQDWFHGKCVHVTKAMGEQMENQGIEWVCPNCLKKKNDETKAKSAPRKQRNTVDIIPNESNRISSISTVLTSDIKVMSNSGKICSPSAGVTHCVVCKKEARKSSIYCSDACILAHAEVTSTKDKPSSSLQDRNLKTDSTSSKLKSDVRIIVFDKKTGKVLTGTDAPTALNLKVWLKEHPTYEVVKSNNLNTIQFEGKTVAAINQGIKTNKLLQDKSSSQSKMSFSKVIGSKQTILTPSTKKTVLLTDIPSTRSAIASPQSRSKQVTLINEKIPAVYHKQIGIKTTLQQQQQQQQQQQISQRSVIVPLPKSTSKKVQEVKASTSQLQQIQQPLMKNTLLKKPETEPIRLNVRKTLAELLSSRIKETNDLNLNEDEIIELALNIELEMYKFFKDAGAKYKAKYRSLVFNIKDTKNLTLFRKIANRSLSPDAVVKLSPEEMASQELAEWREKENKHQLEMIKKNELDLMAQAKSIVVKTHKGEQIIENDGTIERVDPKTPVQDIVTALNSGETISSTVEEDNKQNEERLTEELKKLKTFEEDKKKKEKERDKEKRHGRSRNREKRCDRTMSKIRHRRSRDRDRSKDKKSKKDGKYKDRVRDKDKDKERDKSRDLDKKKDKDRDKKDKYKQSRSDSRSRSKNRHKEHKEKHKKDEEKKKEVTKNEMSTISVEKAIEDRLWRHIEDETTTNTLDGNDSDISDREPSSTVTIKTPDINEDLDKDILESNLHEGVNPSTTVWRGFVYMADVAKFFVTAQNVSGNSKDLMEDLPESFDVVGRINPLTVWDYISKMKKNATKEILIIKLTATNDEEKIPYITLYSYLNSRNRLGVLGNISPSIKDFYIMPFSNGSKLPSVLLPLDAPDLEENRQHLLLGIIVVQRKKRSASISIPLCPVLSKISKKDHQQPVDRSYMPLTSSQLSIHEDSMTPPNSPKQTTQIKVLTHDIKQSLSIISKIVPELSSKISLESSSSSDKLQLDDDDEPYSPGEPVDVTIDDDEDALSSSSSLKLVQSASEATITGVSPIKSSTELQRKMEELSRQIEEEKQQIQNISSSFLGDTTTTLPGLGLDPPNSCDTAEAYSPSDARSFTPPPQGISKLAQPILDKVSNITIPPNLQEILANVKRQESSKMDPYLPSKPSATFLTTVNLTTYQNSEKYSPTCSKTSSINRLNSEMQSSIRKETKSTLSSLSDYDIMMKAEEELAALAAASIISTPSLPTVMPSVISTNSSEPPPPGTSFEIPHR